VHDLSLPGDPGDDVGRGAPLSRGGRAFLEFAANLGFHGLQLGPQGETDPQDPSPYDATLFSRNISSIGLAQLVEERLVPGEALADAVAARPQGALWRAAHVYAHEVSARIVRDAWQRSHADRGLQGRVRRFAEGSTDWLERDELYAALETLHREPDWHRWPDPDRSLLPADARARRAALHASQAEEIAVYRFGQLLAHEQHEAFRLEARRLGLLLFGDLQIGISNRDSWSYRTLLVPWLRMGAPPSRTNPEGQPWGYGVLDPALYGARTTPGAALEFVRARVGKVLDEFDGLRVDHPHGLIDPWVYSADHPDPLAAVQAGARLFSSPERSELAHWAIARLDQLDRSQSLHADGRVRELTAEQVDRYAAVFDVLVDAARARGRSPDEIIAEVLSTQPYPVRRVLERHGLGRFRVTQKAALGDPADVYRAENARPQDWIMAGTHDTEPIWLVAERWLATGSAEQRGLLAAGAGARATGRSLRRAGPQRDGLFRRPAGNARGLQPPGNGGAAELVASRAAGFRGSPRAASARGQRARSPGSARRGDAGARAGIRRRASSAPHAAGRLRGPSTWRKLTGDMLPGLGDAWTRWTSSS